MNHHNRLNNTLRTLISGILALGVSLAIFFMPSCASDEVYTNAVRLHVVANSDSDEDQSVKLLVRDEILACFSSQLCALPHDASSFDYLNDNKDSFEQIAMEVLEQNGYYYGANVDIGIHTYPTRMYEDATLPAGEYKSIRVILGDGDGQNWWCVVYPPMCLGIEETELEDIDDIMLDDLSQEESIIIKSWILDFLNKDTPQPNDKAKNRLLTWLNKLGKD